MGISTVKLDRVKIHFRLIRDKFDYPTLDIDDIRSEATV